MKILNVRSFAHIVQLNTYNLQEIGMAKGLIKAGHTCDVVYYNGKEEDRIQDIEFPHGVTVRIHWLKGFPILRDGYMPALKKLVQSYDIVIFDSYNAFMSLWAVRHIPAKCILYQGPYPSRYTRRYQVMTSIIDTLFYRWIDKSRLTLITKSCIASDFLRSKGFSDVTTVGVGLNTDNLTPDSVLSSQQQDLLHKILRFKGTSRLLLYVGVWEKRRNVSFLLECLHRLSARYGEYKLLLVGKDKDAACRKEVTRLITRYQLQGQVLHIPSLHQSELSLCYQQADAFLFPTSYEIFGMVLLEAMYFGLPAFTTYNGGSSALIDGTNGTIIQQLDVDTWCRQIDAVLSDEGRLQCIKANAHRTIVNGYTWEAMAGKLISVFKDKLHDKQPARQ